MDTELSLPILLLWLDEQAREKPGQFVPLRGFAGDDVDNQAFVGNLATHLEQQGYIMTARTFGEEDFPDSTITSSGKAEAQRIRTQRADPVARHRYACDGVIAWMFAHHRTSAGTVSAFFLVEESVFLGQMLTVDEVLAAVQYLADRGLVIFEASGNEIRLTADGLDCAISGDSVSEFLSRKAAQAAGPVFHIQTNTGNIAVGGSNVTQNATSTTGMDVTVLAAFATLVRQLAPSLTPLEDQRQELLAEVAKLDEAVAAPERKKSLLKTLANGLMSTLRSLGHSPDVQRLAVEAGEQAIKQAFGG